MERTVWQESKMILQSKSGKEIGKEIIVLQKDDKRENDQCKRDALRKLRDYARQSNSAQKYIAEQGAIEWAINLLKSGTPFVKQDAACSLGNLAFGNDSNCEEILEKGGIELLIGLLDGTEAQPEYAAYALGRIAFLLSLITPVPKRQKTKRYQTKTMQLRD